MPSRFSNETFQLIQKDLRTGKLPLDYVRLADDKTPGLRAVVPRKGEITFQVFYMAKGMRRSLRFEEGVSIAEARGVASRLRRGLRA